MTVITETLDEQFFFFYLFTTRLHHRWCHGVSLSASLPRVHSVSLCGRTTKIQPKLKRSKVTPNPPAARCSQEHHGKSFGSFYGTDKKKKTKKKTPRPKSKNKSLKTVDQAHPPIHDRSFLTPPTCRTQPRPLTTCCRWGQVSSGELGWTHSVQSVFNLSVLQSEPPCSHSKSFIIFIPLDPRLQTQIIAVTSECSSTKRFTCGKKRSLKHIREANKVRLNTHLSVLENRLTWRCEKAAAIGTVWWTLWWPNTPVYTPQRCRTTNVRLSTCHLCRCSTHWTFIKNI